MVATLQIALVLVCVIGHVASYDPETLQEKSPLDDALIGTYLTKDYGVVVKKKAAFRVTGRKCSCSGTVCQCCVEAKLKIFFKLKACAGFAYNPGAKALDVTITIDDHPIFKKTISVPTPVKLCHQFSIHGLSANICVGLNKISFEKGHFGACIYMEIQAAMFHWKQKLGCLYKSTLPRRVFADYGKNFVY